MRATHFVRIGGYDQSYLPSGFQDVCIHQRVRHLGGSCRTITGKDVGLSIPNDLGNETRALGPAKVANVNPQHQNMSWGKMNTENMAAGTLKIGRGQWRRNMDEADHRVPPRTGHLQGASILSSCWATSASSTSW